MVNFAPGAGLDGQVTQAAYGSAREAIRGLSRVVANDWAKDDIRVNVVSPMALTSGAFGTSGMTHLTSPGHRPSWCCSLESGVFPLVTRRTPPGPP